MSRTRRIVRSLVAVGMLVTVVLLAACTSASPSDKGTSSSPDAKPAVAPTLTLVTPAAGSTVAAGEVEVTIETSGLKFTMPSNTNVAGEGHVHFSLDGGPIVMSTEKTTTLKDVKPGAHKLVAELVQNDTTPFDPRVEQEIEFTAK